MSEFGREVADRLSAVLGDALVGAYFNAARAWRFAVEDELGSKLEGAAWARERWHQPSVIDAAVGLRLGRSAPLDASDVAGLLDHVQHVLATSR